MQNPHNHPVKLRLPPLHRRGISWYRPHNHPVRLRRRVQTRYDCSSVFVLVISPPKEGNWWRGAVEMVQTRHNHPVKLRLPPLHRRGIGGAGGRDGTDPAQPPRQAELDTPPQEGNWWRGAVEMVQTRHNHPVKRSLTPLHRRGMV